MPEKKLNNVLEFNRKLESISHTIGNLCVDLFHYLALFAIGGAVVWSATHKFFGMVGAGSATIEDILLLFIYLELGAMVGIYFRTKRMPVRFLIYVAITALTRMMVGLIQTDHTPDLGIIYISAAILILATASLIIRYGSAKYPSESLRDDHLESSA